MKKIAGRLLLLVPTFLCLLLLFQLRAKAAARVGACQCTDFVYTQRPDIPLGMGHAKDWLTSARVHRLPYDQVPQLGDVAVFINGEAGFSQLYGHVAMVIGVNEERDQFSTAGWDGFKADCQLEVHRDLPVTANTFFIHRRLSPEEASGGDYPFWEHATLDALQVYSELQ